MTPQATASTIFYYGQITRDSLAILSASNAEEISVLLLEALHNLGLHGVFSLTSDDSRYTRVFGNGLLKRETFSIYQDLQDSRGKVIRNKNSIAFQFSGLTVIVACNQCQEDGFIDPLTLLLESINIRLNTLTDLEQDQDAFRKQLDQLAHMSIQLTDTNHSLLTLMETQQQEVFESILSTLLVQFNNLGLEIDQEDQLLNQLSTLQSSHKLKMKKTVESIGSDLKTLHTTIRNQMSKERYKMEPQSTSSANIELF